MTSVVPSSYCPSRPKKDAFKEEHENNSPRKTGKHGEGRGGERRSDVHGAEDGLGSGYGFTEKYLIKVISGELRNNCMPKARFLWCIHSLLGREKKQPARCIRKQSFSGLELSSQKYTCINVTFFKPLASHLSSRVEQEHRILSHCTA